MADFQFYPKEFFDKLFNKNHPEHEFVEVQELMKTSRQLPVELERFHQKSKNLFIIFGIVLLCLSIANLWYKDLAGLIFLIMVIAVLFAFLRISYKPDKILKAKLKQYRKKVSTGIVTIHPKSNRRRIYRSRKDVALMGVAAGIAEYLGIPVSIIRMIFLAMLFTTSGFFLFFYILLASFIPEEPIETDE